MNVEHQPCSATNNTSTTKQKSSAEQKALLVQYLEENPELKNGKFTPTFTYKTSQNCWKEITENLNAVGAVAKDWKQWRKTWQDMKSKAKARGSEIKKHREGTGGGKPVKELTDEEVKIIEIMGPTLVDGHMHTPVSDVTFLDDPEAVNEVVTKIDETLHDHVYCMDGPSMELEGTFTPGSRLKILETAFTGVQNSQNENAQQYNTPLKTPNNSRVRKQIRTQRLDNTLRATEKLAAQTDIKLEMKQSYYNKKLKLIEESNTIQKKGVTVQERIASALEKIAAKM